MKTSIIVSGSKEFLKFYKGLEKDDPLKQKLDDAIYLLKKNPNAGNRIKTKLWPTKYIKKYGINNLYRYPVGSSWRVLYTIIG